MIVQESGEVQHGEKTLELFHSHQDSAGIQKAGPPNLIPYLKEKIVPENIALIL